MGLNKNFILSSNPQITTRDLVFNSKTNKSAKQSPNHFGKGQINPPGVLSPFCSSLLGGLCLQNFVGDLLLLHQEGTDDALADGGSAQTTWECAGIKCKNQRIKWIFFCRNWWNQIYTVR
jgi:hypothetical protein